MRADALRKFLGNSVVLANTLPYPLSQVKHLCPKRNKTQLLVCMRSYKTECNYF